MEHKQVIVLRKDLNMRKGKMVAQGAHASMLVAGVIMPASRFSVPPARAAPKTCGQQ
jgi:peptidyl-tRNA hydrolase